MLKGMTCVYCAELLSWGPGVTRDRRAVVIVGAGEGERGWGVYKTLF